MNDECKIVRWTVQSDIFKSTDLIKPSAVFTVTGDETLMTRWLTQTDIWKLPKPSAVYTVTGNETKAVSWNLTPDTWVTMLPGICRISKIEPTHLYKVQHDKCELEVYCMDDATPISFKVILNEVEVSSMSPIGNRTLPITLFVDGYNAIQIVSDGGKTTSATIEVETVYRNNIYRTFKIYDGGYILNNIELNDYAKILN